MTKQEVLEFFSAQTEEQAKRNAYKYTDCGMFVEFKDDGIVVGSIVEGSDYGTTTFDLNYGSFNKDYLETVIKEIESEATIIWDWANTPRENGLTDAESGHDFPI